MISILYPSQLKKLFTNRKRELAILKQAIKALKKGEGFNLSFWGQRRIGKSLLVKEFIDNLPDREIIPCYLNIQGIATSPENFAAKYIGWICYWFLTKGQAEIEPYLHFTSLQQKTAEEKDIRNFLFEMQNILQEQAVDRNALIRKTFSFASYLSRKYKIKMILFLDEFQDIENIARFRDCSNILGVFREYIEDDQVTYVLLGSVVSAMQRILAEHQSPLFGQFKQYSLNPFTKEDSLLLMRKILTQRYSAEPGLLLYQYTQGQPYYISILADKINDLIDESGQKLTEQKIKEAIILEVLSPEGRLYNHLKYVYDISIERAAFSAVLKSILNILANQEGLNQSQIARKLKSGQGAVRNYLRSLEEVDLVFRQENKYYIKDNFLRYWIYYQERGVELLGMPKKKELQALIQQLQEKFSRVSTELGVAKEAEIRELLRKMQGRTFRAELFGLKQGNLKIPKFKTIEQEQDKKREIDILASNTHTWAVEIKWRNQVIDKQELQKFKSKIKANKYWFIAKAGLTKDAAKYAKRAGIMFSDQNDLAEITRSA